MLDKILQFSIKNRWLVILFTCAVALVGVFSLTRLPIDAVPDITNNQIQINTLYAPFSPTEIEKQITFPIETSLAGIPGLQYTRSISRNGFSQVTAVFDDSLDIYFARQQVGERLLEARESLPQAAEPKMGAISTGLGEVYMWVVEYEHPEGKGAESKDGQPGWQSNGSYLTPEGQFLKSIVEKASYLREIQDWVIRPQLKNVLGVAGVDAIGGYEKQYSVEPVPQKLIALNLTFSDLIEALERNNISTGAGYIEHRGESYVVRASGLLASVDEIGSVVIGERGGTPIHIHDVASVGIGKELRTGSASENGNEVVVGTALMLIGGNSRTVAQAVDSRVQEINKSLPPGIFAKPVLNRTKLVDATISTVQKNLFEGAVLVIVVLFLLLGNIRAAFITASAIPLSMLITATGMVQAKISGNLMSLGAIDFGLIVDGAVIIVENCIKRLAEKQHELGRRMSLHERLHEVMVSAKEMIQPSVFGQAIIITVYLPILFLTGVEGKMFFPMAATVIFALVAAFILSLTFIPALIAVTLNRDVVEKENRFLNATKRFYEKVLTWALSRKTVVVGGAVGSFVISLFLFTRLGQEFIPTLDEKDIAMHAMRMPSTGLTQSTDMQAKVERVIGAFPEVLVVFSKTGTAEMASDPMPPNVSDTFVKLKPKDEWPNPSESKESLIQRIEEAVEKLPGNVYEFTQPIQMRFNELIAGVRSDVAVKVFGDEFDKLLPTAESIATVLRSVKGAADVKVEQAEGLPMLEIEIDRAKVSRLGLDIQDVQDVVATAIGGKEAGFVFEGDRRFELVVRLPDELRANMDKLGDLPIPIGRDERAAQGADSHESSNRKLIGSSEIPGFVPLKSLASIEIKEGPNQISRENGKRRVVVQANVRGSDIGSFVNEAQEKISKDVKIPSGYWITWGGQFENLAAAKSRLMIVVPICFLMILLLLFSSLGSVRQSLIVFTGVPLALTGGILALWVRGIPFSISAAVGFIALSGVAVLNGLVMITSINKLRGEGKLVEDAVYIGATSRLRPVLMTALVASLGFIPMALATGTGSEVQKPIATVVIGGLITATFLTLVVLPSLYRMFENNSNEEDEL